MRKNIIELTKEGIDELVSRAIKEIPFFEIQKWENYFHGDYLNDGEDYLDDNGDPIMGYLVHEESVISSEECIGEFQVSKEIYILPNGNFEVFYVSHEGEYEDDEEKEQGIKDHLFWRTTRVRSKEKSLSQIEIQDILFELLTEIKKNKQ